MIKTVLAGMFSLLISTSIFAEECCRDTFILAYENYIRQKRELPSDLFAIEPKIITDKILIDEETLVNPKLEQPISGKLFEALCHFEFINRWEFYKEVALVPYPYDYEKFVKWRMEKIKLFYLGETKLSENYRSFLILFIEGKEDEFLISRKLYLINAKGNKCQSMTQISLYFYADGEAHHRYSEKTDKQYFIQKDTILSSDMIDLSQPEGYTEKASCIKFHYDEQGMLKID
ncbi:MAG: hypothetical protein PUB21_11175 [Bacteroidales bacterium]|nr:hypothetical protein [Bacteroidales bacterium]